MELTVDAAGAGQRLDRWLAAELPGHSRTRIRQLVDGGYVSVDGRARAASYRLKGTETVTLTVPDTVPADILPEDIPLDVLYEDNDLLVVNKAPGMVAHPLPGTASGTLVNALLYHCTDLSGINGVERPGIVHRLDRETSGCLVVAKNDAAHRGLAAQFKDRQVRKEYLAVVWGAPDPPEGEITTEIGRDPVNRTKMSTAPRMGRTAVSRYALDAVYGPCSTVKVRIVTGRTHQIRVHMAHINHPVVADAVYGGDDAVLGRIPERYRAAARRCLKAVGRQALHARSLSFTHPVTGAAVSFEAPLPEDMTRLLEFLEKEFPRPEINE